MSFTVAIAGRPNVGKSTLFNRLVGKSMALVSDVPGVTRDWREGNGELFDLKFRVLDTAGLEDARQKGSLAARTASQTGQALAQTDVVLLVVDAREGVTDGDKAVAHEIRKSGKPIILVGNKCDGDRLPATFDELTGLGFGEPVPVSALHAEGLIELHEALQPLALRSREREGPAAEQREGEGDDEKSLHIAIVGRPNAGKSTLINRLIGEERMLTGPEPGLTRDAIPIAWEYKGKPVRLVDTAGLRRRAKITEALEKMSAGESLRAIRLAHVVVLVIDAVRGFDKQDLAIARHVTEEGRALAVAVNKWDLVKDKKAATKLISDRAEESLAQVAGLPLIHVSALKGDGLDDLMKAIYKLYEIWNIRVSTGKLNRWLEDMEMNHPPPISSGRRIKLRYITQIKSRPPTFSLFVNNTGLPESYQRFLTHGLRDVFKLKGVPIRWQIKKSDNPFGEKNKKKR